MSIIIAGIMVSKVLIESAQLNKIQIDATNIQVLTNVFRDTFDCLAGDCPYKQLPNNIISQTPSGCFNLQTDYITPLSSPIITTGFNTGEIDQNAKRSCMFYEFMALEQQSGLQKNTVASKINSVVGVQSANALTKILLYNNTVLQNIIAAKTDTANATIATNNTAITTKQATVATNTATIATNNTAITTKQATVATNTATMAPHKAILDNITNNQNNMTERLSTVNNVISGAGCRAVTDSDMSNLSVNNSCAWQRFNQLQCGSNNNCGTYCNSLCYLNDFNSTWLPSYNSSKAVVDILKTPKLIEYETATNTVNTKTAQNTTLNGEITTATNTVNTLTAQLAISLEPNTYLAMSVNSATNPAISNTLTSSMWDSITVKPTNKTYPYEASNLPGIIGKQLLISRNTSTNNINSTDINGIAIAPENDKMAGFSASFSRKIDIKFDDGKPYTGNIIAGKNVADLANIKGCTNISLANFTDVTNNLNADYAKGNSLMAGCVIGFIVR